MLRAFRYVWVTVVVAGVAIGLTAQADQKVHTSPAQASVLSGGLWEPVLAETYVTVPEPTTTTTEAPAPPQTAPRQVVQAPTNWPASLQPCGGDLPPCSVKDRESHGDYNARNPWSSACGAWQFIPSTWNGFGGYPSACDAPPAVQDEKARALWAGGAGCSHWSAC